jgi:hypothetical protein
MSGRFRCGNERDEMRLCPLSIPEHREKGNRIIPLLAYVKKKSRYVKPHPLCSLRSTSTTFRTPPGELQRISVRLQHGNIRVTDTTRSRVVHSGSRSIRKRTLGTCSSRSTLRHRCDISNRHNLNRRVEFANWLTWPMLVLGRGCRRRTRELLQHQLRRDESRFLRCGA